LAASIYVTPLGYLHVRILGRFLFESRSHLILLDASARCAGLVEVLLFAVPSLVDRDPVEAARKIQFHLAHEVTGEAAKRSPP
jgi:hypothetical protein